MAIEYKILKSEGVKNISIELPKEFSILQGFLNENTLTTNDAVFKWVLDGVDEVLTGKQQYTEKDGEVYGLKIQKDKTVSYDTFAEEAGDVKECTVNTKDLKQLLLEWRNTLQKNKK